MTVTKRYSAEEVARILGVSAETIRRRARTGEIKGGRVGSQWRFSADVVAHLEACADGEAA